MTRCSSGIREPRQSAGSPAVAPIWSGSAREGERQMATRIGIAGCAGRMGRMLVAEIQVSDGALLAGGVEGKGSSYVGRDIGELAGMGTLGLKVGTDPAALFAAADVVIEFALPPVSVAHAQLAAGTAEALVTGT